MPEATGNKTLSGNPIVIGFGPAGMFAPFDFDGYRIRMTGLPEQCPDETGVAVIKLEFDEAPSYRSFSRYPQLNGGRAF